MQWNQPDLVMTHFLSSSEVCLFLVHPKIDHLEDAAARLLSVYRWPHLSVGKELGATLLTVLPQNRSMAAVRWLNARLNELAPGPVLCADIALLFEPSFQLDPLKILLDIGRTTRLVVAWPGNYADDVLSYALPDHGHYRTWRKPDGFIVPI